MVRLRVALTATPLYGHVAPVLLGHALAQRGHTVTLLTGEAFRDLAVSQGLRFVALPADAEIPNALASTDGCG